MNEETDQTQPRFGEQMLQALRTFLLAVIRLIVIVLTGTILGLVVYLGFPWLYRQVFDPVQENAAQIEVLQELHKQDRELINQRVERLTKRIEDLEKLADSNKEASAELEGQFFSQIEEINNSISDLSNESISTNEELANLDAQLRELNTALTRLSRQVDSNSELFNELQVERERDLEPLDRLLQQVNLLKVMELLTRSRLHLIQNNPGSAEQEVQVAREEMVRILTRAQDSQVEVMREVVTRLDLALESLPATPELAAVDLEVAWQLVARGLTDQPPQPFSFTENTSTLTPASTPPATTAQPLTPTPATTGTPTP